jgi:hypothetical protein
MDSGQRLRRTGGLPPSLINPVRGIGPRKLPHHARLRGSTKPVVNRIRVDTIDHAQTLLLPRCFLATTGHAPRSSSGLAASSLIVPFDINVFVFDISMVNDSLHRRIHITF